MKKMITSLSLALFLIVPLAPKAQAMMVYDPSVEAQMILNVANTAQQIEMQLQNLIGMNGQAAAGNMAQIQKSLADLQALQQQATGLTMDYRNFQKQYDSTYPDFSTYAGMSASEYAAQAEQLTQATQKQIYDAMWAQGLISGVPGDAENLQNLLKASQSSQGALAAAQAGNQISGLITQQMMRLQQMIAQSNQAQLAYQDEQKHREAMAHEASKQLFSRGETE
jgi:P-type conjugative transfer protein TrbJ